MKNQMNSDEFSQQKLFYESLCKNQIYTQTNRLLHIKVSAVSQNVGVWLLDAAAGSWSLELHNRIRVVLGFLYTLNLEKWKNLNFCDFFNVKLTWFGLYWGKNALNAKYWTDWMIWLSGKRFHGFLIYLLLSSGSLVKCLFFFYRLIRLLFHRVWHYKEATVKVEKEGKWPFSYVWSHFINDSDSSIFVDLWTI